MISMFDPGCSEIDFSFAICPRRKAVFATAGRLCRGYLAPAGRCSIERTSFYLPADDDDHGEFSSSAGSARSVTFAANPVSGVVSVPRYESRRLSELFYSKLDIMRFKQEVRLERIGMQAIW